MSAPYLGELRWFAFSFPPKSWAFCNGQLLAINQNQALFALLGTTFGGDGTTTFALPNVQGGVATHAGGGLTYGQTGGEQAHTLIANEMPAHSHPAQAVSTAGTAPTPGGNYWAASTISDTLYSTSAPTATMINGTVSTTGGGQSHPNLQPYLTLNLAIALQGVFPSRS